MALGTLNWMTAQQRMARIASCIGASAPAAQPSPASGNAARACKAALDEPLRCFESFLVDDHAHVTTAGTMSSVIPL
jgi:hypothetical protein